MKLWFNAWRLLIITLLLTLLSITSDITISQTFAQSPQVKSKSDRYGNIIYDGERRFNYLVGKRDSFTKIELDEQSQVISRQNLSESPFTNSITVASPERSIEILTSSAEASDPTFLELEWKYGLFGSGIGLSGISVFDIDGDDNLEMVMGGTSNSGFGENDFWYVVKQTGLDAYDQVWLSPLYSTSINQITVADVNNDKIAEIYVGLANGKIHVYDGFSLTEIGSFQAGSIVYGLTVANADADGDQEIVSTDGSKIYVHSALSLALEWASSAYGGTDLAVGNVDADPAPEIVTTTDGGHGYVVDGASHALEWDYIDDFGNLIELGDIDADNKAEIIGAEAWYRVIAFDADIKTPKWEIPTDLDNAALHVADTDGDGRPEILLGDGQWGAIHCYDSLTRTEKWFINNPEHGVTDIALGDVNHDGVLEVLWGAGATSTGADFLFIADTVTRQIEWQNVHIDGPLTAVDIGDVDDDGQDEIVMVSFQSNSGYDDGIIHIFDATTHTLEWRSSDLPDIHAWTGVPSVKIGDVDDDGQTEFVLATADLYDGLIQIYNGKSHSLERQSSEYDGASFTALAIGDVDNDGKTEIVVGQKREHTGAAGVYLIVFDGKTATEEWKSVGLNTYWGYVYDLELANVDNDDHPEIIASVAGERIYVYDGVSHQQDWLAAIPAYALESFDVDADGQVELLVGKDNGTIEIYSSSTFTLEDTFNPGGTVISGLVMTHLEPQGVYEWLVSGLSTVAVFRGQDRSLIWQNDTHLGTLLGNFNHLHARDIDHDGAQEVVFGSSFALYQFEGPLEEPLVYYLPLLFHR